MLPTITIDGRLTADPELRFTPSGKAVTTLRVAANDSRKLDDGSYENLEQIFVNVSLWEAEAENAVEHYRRGDRVLVTGRIYQRDYDNRDGGKGTSLELKFPTVAKVAAARPANAANSARSAQQRQQQPAAAAADSPWAGTPDEPPF